MSRVAFALSLVAVTSVASIASADPLTAEERAARCTAIRDVAADNGISAGYLLAGIASAETALSHCHEELSWACQGPSSPDCGGPVVAGAGDGACSLQQGGLGMFQFDGGTFDDTIARDGDGVLLLSGNITRAVDFVVNMVMGSQYVDASTPEEAKAWMNSVEVDGEGWDAWVKTVTHYYNGCTPTGCSVYQQRYQHYFDHGVDIYDEQGAAFWQVELPPCGTIPAAGRTLEETDTCFDKGGPLPYWRVGIGGESNLHIWTGTTDLAEAVNFGQWTLAFDQAGEYLVEVSIANGGANAIYRIDHAGTTDEIVVDQSTADGFVELGAFQFDLAEGQRVFVGDNTGQADGEKLVIDAIRLTRLDPGNGEGGSAENGGSSPNGGGDGGAPSEGGAGGEGGSPNPNENNEEGCSASPMPRAHGWPALLLALGLLPRLSRRRR